MPIPLQPVAADHVAPVKQQVKVEPKAVVVPKQEAPTVSTFDPANPATWPTCGSDEFVRADNGQCAKKPVAAPVSAPAPSQPQPAVAGGCGDNFYANYIYMHESGCNPASVNSIGCRGIGQACPGSKLPCGADYACQNAYFTRYANERYGGWAGAYSFWVSHHWW